MKRRSFLHNTLKGALVPFFMPGSGLGSMARATFLPSGVCNYNDRVLVVLHLNGANDIINATVPLAQMGTYRSNRPTIHIPQSKLLNLDTNLNDNKQLGLNLGLAAFKNLYTEGQLAIVQRAGYPQPNRSHFASEEIWLKGVDGQTGPNSTEEFTIKHPLGILALKSWSTTIVKICSIVSGKLSDCFTIWIIAFT